MSTRNNIVYVRIAICIQHPTQDRMDITIVSRKRAHGQCTLLWAQTGGWADIRAINIVYY